MKNRRSHTAGSEKTLLAGEEMGKDLEPSTDLPARLSEWLRKLAAAQPELGELLGAPPEKQVTAGYGLTLREICHQPLTWTDTAQRISRVREELGARIRDCRSIVMTGSGSSQYSGECVHPALQLETGRPVTTIAGGRLLMEGPRALPPCRPLLVVSLARSGDSPESTAVVESLLEDEPEVQHLVITCNAAGGLATAFRNDPRVTIVTLNDLVNDRSLVMTSSFTNIVVATRALGMLESPDSPWQGGGAPPAQKPCSVTNSNTVKRVSLERYEHMVMGLAGAAESLLLHYTGILADVARAPFRKAVFLASGCRLGAAREASLKLLEMTAGRLQTTPETYLGLRHGPMCILDRETLLVCFLDTSPLARAYEEDVIREVSWKDTGARKLIVGEGISASLLAEHDLALEIPGLAELGDDNVPVLDAIIGQLLAFFRCRAEGLCPDMPSTGVINRVVDTFAIHNGERKGAG
jgi:tagatose-6-phosphate ketose/aldose isomerase